MSFIGGKPDSVTQSRLGPTGAALLSAVHEPLAVFSHDLQLVANNAAWAALQTAAHADLETAAQRQSELTALVTQTLGEQPGAPLEWVEPLALHSWELTAQVFPIAGERCVLVQARRIELDRELLLHGILDTAVAGLCLIDEAGRFVLVNRTYCEIYGYRSEELFGKTFLTVVLAERHEYAWNFHCRFFGENIQSVRNLPGLIERSDGVKVDIVMNLSMLTRPDGQRFQIISVNDVTLQKSQAAELVRRAEQAEKETAAKSTLLGELDQQLAIIHRQHHEIVALSAPILDVWERIVALPLIGRFDRSRAAAVTEQLLAAVVTRRAQYVLLDLTSCEFVDDSHIKLVAQMVQAIQLLGARCLLTGIRPQVAQSLVTLGVEIPGLTTLRSLQEALRTCIPKVTPTRGT